MRTVRLKGSYHQIGVHSGQNLQSSRAASRPVSAERQRWVLACREELRRWAPELAEEISGLQEAWAPGRANPGHLLHHVLDPGPDPACTALFVGEPHTRGGPLFGRNCDFRPSAHRRAAVHFTFPRNAHPHIGFSHQPVGRYGGVNAEGLTVATAVVPPRGRDGAPGMTFTLAARCILDRHGTVAEACRFLRSIPHVRNVNFLLADGHGDTAVVEAGPERIQVLDTGGKFAGITNHFQSVPEEKARPRLTESRSRLRTLHQWFAERSSPVTEADVQRILADREAGVYADGDPVFPHSTVTLWSWTTRPGSRTVHVAAGFPDHRPYRPHRF